jgi:site-specific recombinase XerC
MSKDVHLVGCTGKRAFARFCQAARAAKRRNRNDGGAHVEPYHCRHCHGFHIGEARDYGKRRRKEEEPSA